VPPNPNPVEVGEVTSDEEGVPKPGVPKVVVDENEGAGTEVLAEVSDVRPPVVEENALDGVVPVVPNPKAGVVEVAPKGCVVVVLVVPGNKDVVVDVVEGVVIEPNAGCVVVVDGVVAPNGLCCVEPKVVEPNAGVVVVPPKAEVVVPVR